MATLGSPPAGWYTDPSGEHRARYWDGGGWTVQVRDDLGAPSPVSGNDQTHGAAATVADIAQALATVAEQDVAEPVFVVDYGGDTPAPVVAPVVATETPSAPRPEPTVAAPADAAPIAGWYPDPAMRHQARFWDGFRWTERVADNGLEGIDPVPGQTTETMAGGVDPAAAEWAAQQLVTADLDGAMSQLAPAETTMSAGQASLAKLADRDDGDQDDDNDDNDAPREHTRATGKVFVAGWMVVVGAVALLVGSTMAWMQVGPTRVGNPTSATGMDIGDGRITVALAILLAVLGAGILTGRMQRFGGTRVAAMGVLVAGAAAVAVTVIDIADVADRAARLGVPTDAPTSIGRGLWLCFLGALLTAAGGLLAFANRERTPRI